MPASKSDKLVDAYIALLNGDARDAEFHVPQPNEIKRMTDDLAKKPVSRLEFVQDPTDFGGYLKWVPNDGGPSNLISWQGSEISVTLTRAEAEALWQALDSLIPQGEHQIDAPGYLGELPLQRFMYFLRTGERTPFV